MGKKDNSKAKEKKAEKKAQEAKKHTKIANVKAANAVDDPLAVLPKPFTVYNKNGLNLHLETVRAPELPDETKVGKNTGCPSLYIPCTHFLLPDVGIRAGEDHDEAAV